MPTVEESLNLAIKHHRSGSLPEAEQIYRDILRFDPNHCDALHLLGVVAHQSQQPHKAIEYITRAVLQQPESAIS